jgi:TolB-like protein/Flp pilus assembly protein TadD/predicted Ser/Thr protein kinase
MKCPKCHSDNPETSSFCAECGTNLSAEEDFSISQTRTIAAEKSGLISGAVFAGRYKIVEELGRGGMGVVYSAEDTKLKRIIALKILPHQLSLDTDVRERFIREAQAAAALDHPHICTLFEADEANGEAFITMAYVKGEGLKERLTKGALDVEEAVDLALQVAEGLNEAHSKAIVHRDIKPANIMLTEKGQAKIMDFGIAKVGGAPDLTTPATVMGTIAYMSPEQAKGEKTDHRTDIWSFGAMLYEMLTGRLPFKSHDTQAAFYSILNEEPEPVKSLSPEVPEEVVGIIRKCLEKDPSFRYQSAGELLRDLKAYKEGRDLQGLTSEWAAKRKRPHKKALIYVLPAAVLLCGLLVLIGYRLLAPGGEEPLSEKKRLVVLPFENLGTAEDAYFADGMTEEITSRLSAISSLGVISRYSAVQYAGTEKTIQEIGKELEVDYILEGTVRWARTSEGLERVRITPQLIQVSDDTHLWAETFERKLDDIFAIQSEIAQNVVEKLGVSLREHEQKAVESPPTENLEAYQAFLRGRYLASSPHFTLDNWNRVIESYRMAVKLDPDFALAHAELSKAHARLYYFQHDLSDERFKMAQEAAERALELDPESAQVHLVLSYYYLWLFRDPDQALRELELAEKGLPNSAEILEAKGYIFETRGQIEEAVDAFSKAFELSPKDASFPTLLIFDYWYVRRFPEGLQAANQAIALAPDEPWPYLGKAMVLWSSGGDLGETRTALEAVRRSHAWAPWAWFWQEVFEGKYKEAIEKLDSFPGEWIRIKMWAVPKSLFKAFAYQWMDEKTLAKENYEAAQSLLEDEIQKWPQDARLHSSLGIAYAALGHKEEAVRMGKRATEILPLSKDAVYGVPYVFDLATIYTLTGEYDKAIEQLELLFSIPSFVSVPWIRMDPRWDSLRGLPRFQELMNKYSDENP